jgi:hypothetical protein
VNISHHLRKDELNFYDFEFTISEIGIASNSLLHGEIPPIAASEF